LLRILSGNYRSFKGSLSINNIPIQNYQLESLRSTLGVYLQQQDIFKGTVLENISMGRKDISVETISDLSEKLGIGNFIKSLEKGFETEIDSSGKKLSSSIIKKILLLRCLSNNPQLLLLDDPFMGLDSLEIDLLQKYFLNREFKRTILIITQIESFAKKCDYIFTIKNNQIIVTKN
nr:ABC transporter ATP-binding protein [Chitinophagales bacterium]